MEILEGASRDTPTFSENIYLTADTFRAGTSEKKTPCIRFFVDSKFENDELPCACSHHTRLVHLFSTPFNSITVDTNEVLVVADFNLDTWANDPHDFIY